MSELREAWSEEKMLANLDQRRVVTLAKCGLLLSTMAGEGIDFMDHGSSPDLYAEVLMALGIEDSDDMDIALEIARDHPDAHLLRSHPVEAEALEAKQLLDALRDESWDLRCFPVPTGGDDADIGWRVIGHWMAKPHERTVAEVYHDDPRDAIREALRARSGMLSAEKEVG